MPPRRATKAAAATPLFADCVFAVSGTFPGYTQSDINQILTAADAGAATSASITKKVTHLITNNAEVIKGSTKVQKAISIDAVSMVTLEWVLDSLKEKKRLDEGPYKVSSSTSSSTTAPIGKRKVSDDADDVKDVVVKKIKALSNKSSKISTSPIKIKQPSVDIYCSLPSIYSVYVDDTVAWDARLNQTNIGQNNNKFYLVQLLQSTTTHQYAVFCRWGRVGSSGQTSTEVSCDIASAQRIFEKKYKDKTKNNWADRDNFVKHPGKYHLLPPDDGDSDNDDDEATKGKKTKKEEDKEDIPIPESKLHPKVQELMTLIFNTGMMNRQMKELDYDADKMPLGKLAKATILHGYEVLKKISEVLDKPSTTRANELTELSSEFYTVIPHNFGRNTPPIIRDAVTLKKKLEMLEALGEIEIAQKLIKENKKLSEALTVNPLDQQFASLNLNKLEPMDKESERFKLIEQYVRNTHGASHGQYGLVIEEVFDLERQGESERFVDSGFRDLHNRRLLWHGSRLTNYVGILSQGLRIAPPEAPATGYMFDKGAYFADCVSKSANYCFTGPSNNTGLMLLCEVALGDMHEIQQSDYNAKANSQKAGKQSTKGCGLSYPDEVHDVMIDDDLRVQAGPLVTENRSGNGYRLQYNEYIVYNTSQIKMRYLLKMKFDYGARRY
ncbi:Poly [ADP-ribose] polymerase 2 [Haplosporangium sp. Z 767]|nr:Poly [ADP-ribose] polymerase 2 [Haplosporangium sp. Z 11]KAF9185314.1 Poly [ADP-ribose] polymerase 2 [Haplosporangium sp. Z 767]